MNELIKQVGNKELTDATAMEEFLNEEAEKVLPKLDKAQAGSIRQMKIKLISTKIQVLNADLTGEEMLLLGTASLDGKIYGYIFRPSVMKAHIEELYMSAAKQVIKTIRLVEDAVEWTVMATFFEQQNLLELNRIINWSLQMMPKDPKSIEHIASKLSWLNKVNATLKARGEDLLTPKEIAQKSLTHVHTQIENQFGKRKSLKAPRPKGSR